MNLLTWCYHIMLLNLPSRRPEHVALSSAIILRNLQSNLIKASLTALLVGFGSDIENLVKLNQLLWGLIKSPHYILQSQQYFCGTMMTGVLWILTSVGKLALFQNDHQRYKGIIYLALQRTRKNSSNLLISPA